MSYQVKSTERLRMSSADQETKALLYLMNLRNDSDEIYYCLIDFFNDVTGLDCYARKSWDLQSKAKTNNSPDQVGRSLVTLFKNYISDLNFSEYILFIGGISRSSLINKELKEFSILNFTDDSREKIFLGLKSEAQDKEYIENTQITKENINSFLLKVTFVIENKNKQDYIKDMVKVNPTILPSDDKLVKIFNEIKKKQSSYKDSSVVENIIINRFDDSLCYGRHIETNQIKMLVFTRILNYYMINNADCPQSFFDVIANCGYEDRVDIVEMAKLKLKTLQFDVNNSENIWRLFSHILNLVETNDSLNVNQIYDLIDYENIACKVKLDTMSLKFLIAIVKDGIRYEN